MTAGSDAHHHLSIGRSYTTFPAEHLSVRAILNSITKGTELHCQPFSTLEGFRKTFYNWFRLRRKRTYLGADVAGVAGVAGVGGVAAGG